MKKSLICGICGAVVALAMAIIGLIVWCGSDTNGMLLMFAGIILLISYSEKLAEAIGSMLGNRRPKNRYQNYYNAPMYQQNNNNINNNNNNNYNNGDYNAEPTQRLQ